MHPGSNVFKAFNMLWIVFDDAETDRQHARRAPRGRDERYGQAAERRIDQLADLEQLTGRKTSNLSRTLHTMANYGLVRLEDGSQGRGRRAVRPVALARCVNLTLDIGFGGKPAQRRVVRRQAEKIAA